jgi:hypothetical protein
MEMRAVFDHVCKFRIRDIVKVVYRIDNHNVIWVTDSMDRCIGKIGTINKTEFKTNVGWIYQIDFKDSNIRTGCFFLEDCLRKVVTEWDE